MSTADDIREEFGDHHCQVCGTECAEVAQLVDDLLDRPTKARDDLYAMFVGRLFATRNTGMDGLLHASMGIASEGGEILDAVKKNFAYGKPLDVENLIEELGDLEFFMQALRSLIGVTREQVIAANVEKLNKRYPGAVYSDAAAIARADKA